MNEIVVSEDYTRAVTLDKRIKANSHATTDVIGQSLGISDRMARKHIATLRGAQLIERIGGNKTGYWRVNFFTPFNRNYA